MIHLNAKEIIFAMIIIGLNVKVSTKKIMIALVFEINSGNIYIEIALINQDIIVLLQIVILKSEIWCFETVIFLFICCFIDIVTKDKYS